MSFRAISIDIQIEHASQADVQAAAHDQIFQGLDLKAKIEALAAEYVPLVQKHEPDAAKALVQARRWAVEGLCDYLAALAEYELVFLNESDDES